MTTIAWDSKILAADKRVCWGTTPCETVKIFRRADGALYGASGEKKNTTRFLRWCADGCNEDVKPTLDESFSGILIENGQCFQFDKDLIKYHINKPFWAIGSGTDYALGAMAAGKDAIQAVEIAITLDVHSGNGVDWLYFDKSHS